MNTEEKIYLTQESLDDYKNELNHLQNVLRPQVIEEIKEARGQGDLSENAEYDAARDKQAQVEGRIAEIQHILENYELIVEGKKANIVTIGSYVKIHNKDDESVVKEFQIVGALDADPFNKKISNHTPLAKACLGQKVGDIVEVDAPIKYEVKIDEIH
ncbi:transcription elongation factor GreA [Mycoplasma phocoenae]|uniref:Transcription elongation factor GreA n=1 Tax=Mycoplasma phocoenae TaxID=754517 RepID=A0A858U1M8_9MOLU|nr:transcription elongation factor GreA [Mycoplasma phocoenae]QJG67024.1 transcription elongation factor GreA [Mycoplasma phocoenae]